MKRIIIRTPALIALLWFLRVAAPTMFVRSIFLAAHNIDAGRTPTLAIICTVVNAVLTHIEWRVFMLAPKAVAPGELA